VSLVIRSGECLNTLSLLPPPHNPLDIRESTCENTRITPAQETPMSFSDGHALLIGVGSYIHHTAVTNLPTTVEDVRQLAALLTDPQYCGYPASR
jgi:hypothetical protein